MFYFIVSKLPIISGITDGTKLYKILVIGSICYVVLHAILYSNIGENIELIRTYRKYMYYLWALDGVLTVGYMKFFILASKELEDNTDNYKEDDDDNGVSEDNHYGSNGLTREQVLQKLKEQDNKRDSSSPFIKRDELTQTKVPQNPTTSVTSGQTLNQTSPKNIPPQINENNNKEKEDDVGDMADMSDTDIPSYKSPVK
jgi:hypothetical protein